MRSRRRVARRDRKTKDQAADEGSIGVHLPKIAARAMGASPLVMLSIKVSPTPMGEMRLQSREDATGDGAVASAYTLMPAVSAAQDARRRRNAGRARAEGMICIATG